MTVDSSRTALSRDVAARLARGAAEALVGADAGAHPVRAVFVDPGANILGSDWNRSGKPLSSPLTRKRRLSGSRLSGPTTPGPPWSPPRSLAGCVPD